MPMEVWRQVAQHMSTRDLAGGRPQVWKAFRHLGATAICLSSDSGDNHNDSICFRRLRLPSSSVRHAVRYALL